MACVLASRWTARVSNAVKWMWHSDLDIVILNVNLSHILNKNIPNCINQYFSVFVSFSTKIQCVCKCFSMSCFSVLQNTSCWCGVPARTKEGSVPAGQSTRSKGGWPSAGLWLESAKEIQSKTTSHLNYIERKLHVSHWLCFLLFLGKRWTGRE